MLLMAVGLCSCNGEYDQAPVTLPEGGIGTGAWNNPMTAYQALLGSVNDDIAEPWVTGYIVGWIDTDVATVVKDASAKITVPATVKTNLLIASNPKETNWENMASVQLPSGAVRNALNLGDHPENLGVQVTIKGTTGSKYCGVYGVRSVSDYKFGPEGKDDGSDRPQEPVDVTPVASLFCNFDSSDQIADYLKQGWSNVVVSGGLSGWFIKNYQNNNYVSVNALKGTAQGGPYEEWLIAPPVGLSQSPKKSVTFRCQSAYPAPDCTLEVYLLDSADPRKANATKLNANIPVPPESGYSAWLESNIDLSAFSGVVYIGWKYYSKAGGSNASATYCIDDVNIGGASGGSGDKPDTPVTPGTSSVIYEGLAPVANGADGWTFDNVVMPEGLSYVWNWRDYNNSFYLNGSAYANNSANAAEAYAISPVISLEGYTGVTAVFEHAAKFQTTLTTLCGLVIREAGSKEWTSLTIPSWPAAGSWTFSSSGNVDLSAFAGKRVEIAFKYGSTAQGADTWEIKNLKVSGTK